MVELLGVHQGEQIGDGDVLGTSIHAVAAGGAGDQVHPVEDRLHPIHGGPLLRIQRPEVLHKGDVVLHLLRCAHTGEHHQDALEAGGEADGIAGGAAAVELVQHSLGLGRQVGQMPALHRLHHQHGLVVAAAHLVAQAALDTGVVIVGVVELDLHHLDLGIGGEDLLQHLRPVVEGDAHMADLALGLQGEGRLIGPALPEVAEVPGMLRVHQVEIEVLHAAGLQLALKEGADVCLGLEVAAGELIRQHIAVSGVAAGETVPQGRLALALQIAVGGVEVVKARLQKCVHHLTHLDLVYLVA